MLAAQCCIQHLVQPRLPGLVRAKRIFLIVDWTGSTALSTLTVRRNLSLLLQSAIVRNLLSFHQLCNCPALPLVCLPATLWPEMTKTGKTVRFQNLPGRKIDKLIYSNYFFHHFPFCYHPQCITNHDRFLIV